MIEENFANKFEETIRNNTLMMLFISEKKLSLEFSDWSQKKIKDLIDASDILNLDK